MNDANHILPEGNDAEKKALLQQLNEDLFADDHEEELFAADAEEGLQQMKEEDINSAVQQLNAGLNRQLKKKKKRRRDIPDQSQTYIIIVTILLLIIIAYFVIKRMGS